MAPVWTPKPTLSIVVVVAKLVVPMKRVLVVPVRLLVPADNSVVVGRVSIYRKTGKTVVHAATSVWVGVLVVQGSVWPNVQVVQWLVVVHVWIPRQTATIAVGVGRSANPMKFAREVVSLAPMPAKSSAITPVSIQKQTSKIVEAAV
jgi:hypothetical protein